MGNRMLPNHTKQTTVLVYILSQNVSETLKSTTVMLGLEKCMIRYRSCNNGSEYDVELQTAVFWTKWRTQDRRRPFKKIRQIRSHLYNYKTGTKIMSSHKIRLKNIGPFSSTSIQSSPLS